MQNLIQPYLTDIIQALVTLLLLFFTPMIKTLFTNTVTWINKHTTASERVIIHKLGEEAFSYAQTVFKEVSNSQKLDAAFGYLSSRLKVYGINISEQEMRAVIEKAYLAWKNQQTPIVSKPATQADTQPALAANEQVPQTPGTTTS